MAWSGGSGEPAVVRDFILGGLGLHASGLLRTSLRCPVAYWTAPPLLTPLSLARSVVPVSFCCVTNCMELNGFQQQSPIVAHKSPGRWGGYPRQGQTQPTQAGPLPVSAEGWQRLGRGAVGRHRGGAATESQVSARAAGWPGLASVVAEQGVEAEQAS